MLSENVDALSFWFVWFVRACALYVLSVPIARFAMKETNFITGKAAVLVVSSAMLAYTTSEELNQAFLSSLSMSLFRFDSRGGVPIPAAILLQVELFRVTVALMLGIACYMVEIRGPPPGLVDLSGKVYIVTGANSGIGLETSRQLVDMVSPVGVY